MAINNDFREIAASELFSLTGGILAGTLLTFLTGRLELLPGLLILIPGFLEMRGSISGSLSARLSAGLFIGTVKPRLRHNLVLRHNVVASVLLAVVASAFLGLVATVATALFFGTPNYSLIAIALLAAILANTIEIPLAIVTTFYLFRHGHDPNNIMGPYITTTGDIISVVALLLAASVL